MKKLKFIKMHGLGNDFVIIDKREKNIILNQKIINKLSDRRTGAGCDQIITIEKSLLPKVEAKITIYNSNGDEAEACGNGTRCVAKILFSESNKKNITLETVAGKLKASLKKNNNISVNMGAINEKWKKIPLSKKINNRNIEIDIANLGKGFALSIGNPHIVFFEKNINKLNLINIGPKIEKHNFFPNKINVEFIKIINKKKIQMRVWERGVGETFACGSGACAAVFAGYKKNLINPNCEVLLKKGSLFINIINNKVIMTGSAEVSYYGNVSI